MSSNKTNSWSLANGHGRATIALNWRVQLFNDLRPVDGITSPTANGAVHSYDSHRREVKARSTAFVDGMAYRVVEGRFGGVFLTLTA